MAWIGGVCAVPSSSSWRSACSFCHLHARRSTKESLANGDQTRRWGPRRFDRERFSLLLPEIRTKPHLVSSQGARMTFMRDTVQPLELIQRWRRLRGHYPELG